MEITEVRIKLMEDSDDRLQAFCSITFDDSFVVRDLKIIDGSNGPFVAMPSRKLTGHCPKCGCKNHLRAAFCNQCGQRLQEEREMRDAEGRMKLYADVAHPINARCRELIQERVIAEYRHELDRARQPGYVSRYDEDYEEPHSSAAGGEDCACHGRVEPLSYQTAETLPRGPHARGAMREKTAGIGKAHRVEPPKGEFGAGIFD
jgi:stage V sporulation protein G